MITESKAFIDSTALKPIDVKSLTITADTDNNAPTSAKSAPGGATNNDDSSNSPTKDATTKVKGAQSLDGGGSEILTVVTTGGFADTGTIKIDGANGTCTYGGRTETTFTKVTGCSGDFADGANVKGSSK